MESEIFIDNLAMSLNGYAIHRFLKKEGNIFTYVGEKNPKGIGFWKTLIKLKIMNFHFNLFSSTGLFFDIIGVLFLFKYGLPSEISTGGKLLFLESETDKNNRIERNNHIKKMAYLGLGILFIGFIFQLIGSNFS